METPCKCAAIGRGVQTFRIRDPEATFRIVAPVGGDPEQMIGARAVWACRACGEFFAWMRLPYKDDEEILVRAPDADLDQWDWAVLAEVADTCRWRGPQVDVRFVL